LRTKPIFKKRNKNIKAEMSDQNKTLR